MMRAMAVPLPNTVRHHGVNIPRGLIVRTMRGQKMPGILSPDWIEYIPPSHVVTGHRPLARKVVGSRATWYPAPRTTPRLAPRLVDLGSKAFERAMQRARELDEIRGAPRGVDRWS